jgi:hypothetical protein
MTVAHRLTWRAVRSSNWWRGALLLYVVLLAGCYELEPGVAILDVGNSRIPLAVHGVWAEPGKENESLMVVESKDGRVGHVYEIEGAGSARKIKAHWLFLVARAGERLYLIGRTFEKGISPQYIVPVKFDGRSIERLHRWSRPDFEPTAEAAMERESVAAQRFGLRTGKYREVGWLGSQDNSVLGNVSLSSMKEFVIAAASEGLYNISSVFNRLQRPFASSFGAKQLKVWSARDWEQFEALRAQQELAAAKLRMRVEKLLNGPVSNDAAKQALQDGNAELLLASVDGSLLVLELHRRISALDAKGIDAEELKSLELMARSNAAAFGHTESQLWLGRQFETLASSAGLNALNSALRWYELAASSGNADGVDGAKRVLGKLSGLARQ